MAGGGGRQLMVELGELLEGLTGCAATLARSGPRRFSAIGHDSRNLRGGELFAALRTATGDGHAHVAEAVARGAAGILVERPVSELELDGAEGFTAVQVSSVRDALEAWARRRVSRARVVVIAGSLGKSTAQACLRAAWGRADGGRVAGNDDRNDSLGLPLALSEAPGPPSRAVLEVVADGALEEERIARMLRPEVVCVTSTEDASSLYWSTPAALVAGVQRMWPSPGVVVAPLSLPGWVSSLSGPRLIRFGPPGSGAEVTAGAAEGEGGGSWPGPWRCRVAAGDRAWEVLTRLHPALAGPAFAAAVACLLGLGLDPRSGIEALSEVGPMPGRLNPVRTVGGGILLDDTFDATPASVSLALSALERLPAPRLAVLGPARGTDVAGLQPVPGVRVAVVSAVGPSAAPAGARAPEQIGLSRAQTEAVEVLQGGGSVLVKGRAGSGLEELVARLAPAGTRVVRQDPGRRLVTFRSPRRPTWVEIDLAALGANVEEVVGELRGVALMAVVKADAYGHGAVQVARTAVAAGAEWVATATVAEAAELRAAGIEAPCLVLGYTPPAQAEEAVRLGLAITAFDREVLEALGVAASRTGGRAVAHLKVDTGMSRLGVEPAAVGELVRSARGLVDLEGIYTHLRKGEDPNASAAQLRAFQEALQSASSAGHHFRLRHVASSSAWWGQPGARFEMVRLGGELLGLQTADGRRRRPVLGFKTTVAQVRTVGAGTYVGYGDSYRATGPTRIATLPVGYGDGFRRGPRSWGSVLIRGREHPLVGDVCMDMTMVDISADPQVARGDEVVLIGRQGDRELTTEQAAERLGILNYELVSQILPRVPREAMMGSRTGSP